jgi:hypothetical protein
MGGRHKKKIIHVSYRLEGGKSVTDMGYYRQMIAFGKVGMSLLFDRFRTTFALCAKMRPLAQFLLLCKSATFVFVGAPGFEPGAPCSQSKCATGLRYAPIKVP